MTYMVDFFLQKLAARSAYIPPIWESWRHNTLICPWRGLELSLSVTSFYPVRQAGYKREFTAHVNKGKLTLRATGKGWARGSHAWPDTLPWVGQGGLRLIAFFLPQPVEFWDSTYDTLLALSSYLYFQVTWLFTCIIFRLIPFPHYSWVQAWSLNVDLCIWWKPFI